MHDFIKYRLPQQEQIIEQTGFFEPFEHLANVEGFIVSAFEPGRSYRFVEDKGHGQKNKPQGWFYYSLTPPPVISFREYLLETQGIINSFDAYSLEKVVYSRVKTVSTDIRTIEEAFYTLCNRYPNAFVYLISSRHFGCWIGATPEVLVHREGNHLFTMALAGTMRVNDKSNWGAKEKHEQQVVSDYILDVLKDNKVEQLEINGPYTHIAGPVKHLKTDISCTLSQNNFEKIVRELHPTPAVCGIPRDTAATIIGQREMHERDFYTGYIGLKSKTSTRLFVNLRCAQIMKDKAYLYLGGGLTRGSIPELEWEETEHKAQTLEAILWNLH